MNSKLIPNHYQTPQPIVVAELWELPPHLTTALKYIARAGRKDGEGHAEDLWKAVNYLCREIQNVGDYSVDEMAEGLDEVANFLDRLERDKAHILAATDFPSPAAWDNTPLCYNYTAEDLPPANE